MPPRDHSRDPYSYPEYPDYGAAASPVREMSRYPPYEGYSRPGASSSSNPFANPPPQGQSAYSLHAAQRSDDEGFYRSSDIPYSDGRDYQEKYDPFDDSQKYGTHIDGTNQIPLRSRDEYGGDRKPSARAAGGSSKKKWILIGLLALLIVGGIVGGIVAWRMNTGGSGGSSGRLQAIPGTSGVVKSDPNDPSQFEKDSRLHPSFWGLCYTPGGAQEQYGCSATLANVTQDIQLLSQLTTRLRLYGSACNQSSLVLQAIQDTKVKMTVYLGVYIGTNETVNQQQMAETLQVLQTYGTDNIDGITVGNEYILDQYNQDPTTQTTAQTYVLSQVAQFRTQLAALNLSKNIPVGTGDAGSMATTTLGQGIDYFMANVHAYFSRNPVDVAANWVWEYFQNNDANVMAAASNKPTVFIAETGWPSQSMTPSETPYAPSLFGMSQLQTYLDTYVCAANQNSTSAGYFYFEAFDEPWKEVYGGVEPYWGLFDSNRRLKSVTLPNCPSP